MATNPYRDFGLHPDEFGTPAPTTDAAQQPPERSTKPAKLDEPKKSSGSVLNWKRVAMLLLLVVVTGVPKAFLAMQRRGEQRAQQAERKQEVRRQEKMARDLNADIEAVRTGKKKAGPAFHRLFGVPETPENTIKLPAAKAPEKDAD